VTVRLDNRYFLTSYKQRVNLNRSSFLLIPKDQQFKFL